MKTLLATTLTLVSALSLPAADLRVLAPLPVAGATRVAPVSSADGFMFAVAGDNRAAGRDVPMPPTADEIFAELRLIRPAFCLWTGDSIYGSDDTPGEADAEYARFLRHAAVAETPIFNTPGNHEIFKRRDLEAVYTRDMGRLYGSFDYGSSHFIALDTEEVGRPPGIGPEQEAWLRADLEAHRDAAHLFVFMHHPLFPKDPKDGFADPANRDAIHRLFVAHHVDYVFSGHEHLYYASVHDGVHYVVTGGGGAPSDAAPEDGGFQHYVLVRVTGPAIATTVLQPWRLFVRYGPVGADGSCSALVTNYEFAPAPVTLEFPTDISGGDATVSAAWAYKGTVHPLSAAVIPPAGPGLTAVKLVVPKGRAAIITVRRKRLP